MTLPDIQRIEEFTVLVCGGRQYADANKVFDTLDDIHAEHPRLRIIDGGCRGADRLASKWALSRPIFPMNRAVSWSVYEADWHKCGKAAGPIRNQRMPDEGKPGLVVAFGGGKGTADMLKRAREGWRSGRRDRPQHGIAGLHSPVDRGHQKPMTASHVTMPEIEG